MSHPETTTPSRVATMRDHENTEQAGDAPLTPVQVTWVDAVSEDKWQKAQEAVASLSGDWVVKSIGYILRDEPSQMVLCGSVGMDETVCMTIKIPRGMIRKIERMEPPA